MPYVARHDPANFSTQYKYISWDLYINITFWLGLSKSLKDFPFCLYLSCFLDKKLDTFLRSILAKQINWYFMIFMHLYYINSSFRWGQSIYGIYQPHKIAWSCTVCYFTRSIYIWIALNLKAVSVIITTQRQVDVILIDFTFTLYIFTKFSVWPHNKNIRVRSIRVYLV